MQIVLVKPQQKEELKENWKLAEEHKKLKSIKPLE
jgi:hypothetical protein